MAASKSSEHFPFRFEADVEAVLDSGSWSVENSIGAEPRDPGGDISIEADPRE
jgi:hypothetical protein